MRITSFATGEALMDYAAPWLLRKEVANALILGLASRYAAGAEPDSPPPVFIVVENAMGIQAAGVHLVPWKAAIFGDNEDVVAIEASRLLVAPLRAHHASIPAVMGPPNLAWAFAQTWSLGTGVAPFAGRAARVHQLTHLIPPCQSPGLLRRAEPKDRDRLRSWMLAFRREATPDAPEEREHIEAMLCGLPGVGVWCWDDGGLVSMCLTTRDTPRGRCVAGVYTPPESRRRGYASSLVAAVSQAILDDGKQFACLYTDLANPTSNKIYAALGYEPVSDVIDVHLRSKPAGAGGSA